MNLDAYKANALKFGRQHGQALAAIANDTPVDPALNATYYDAIRVFQNLSELTGEDFTAEEATAIEVYRDRYVIPNNGAVPGYWNFTDGLANHALRTGDSESKRAAILLSTNAMYAQDSTPEENTVDLVRSREVAYAMIAMMDAERLGESRRPRLKLLFEQALGHYDQWFVSKTAKYIQPFMTGLTATAIIRYYEQIDKDKRILPALKTGADWIWANAWRQGGFYYDTDSQENPAPDLNMLILPLFAWTWKMGGKPKYRLAQAQSIFDGGVNGAYLDEAKQFNQSYLRGPEALKWLGSDVGPSELDTLRAENKTLKAKVQKAQEALK